MAPTILWEFNKGTEGSASWSGIASTDWFYFAGGDTTSAALDAIDPPTTVNYTWAPELWIGDQTTYGNGSECTTYDHPSEASPNANVMRITFQNEATSTAPKLTAWDTTAHTTVANEILAGTTHTGGESWLKARETTDGAPAQNWCNNSTAVANPTITNALEGNEHYVTCAAAAASNGTKLFNLACAIPSDATAGGTGHTWVYTLKYTYA